MSFSIPKKRNVIIYGKPGAGKTLLAASASEDPRTSPVFYISFKESTVSLEESDYDVEKQKIGSLDELTGCYNYLAKENEGYRLVVFDTTNSVHKHIYFNNIASIEGDADFSKLRVKTGDIWPEFNKAHHTMEYILQKFNELPINVIYLAHSMEVKYEGELIVVPEMLGNFWETMVKPVDCVWYLGQDTETEERVLFTKNFEGHFTKTNCGPKVSIDEMVYNPTISKMWDLLKI